MENTMSHTIKLSDEIFNEAYKHAQVENRSIPKQIEYWSRIGKIAEENPELNYSMIKQILLSLQDISTDSISEYRLDNS